jgi:hypothetical protein
MWSHRNTFGEGETEILLGGVLASQLSNRRTPRQRKTPTALLVIW